LTYRMKQNLKILSSQKKDGRFNFGKVVGIELTEDAYYLGYKDKKEFLDRFTIAKYKLAYIDCFTKRACTEWFNERELSTEKK